MVTLIFTMLFIDIASPLFYAFVDLEIPREIITGLSFILFALLVFSVLLAKKNKHTLLLIALLLIISIKWSIYIVMFNDMSLRKDILALVLFCVVLFENSDFRETLCFYVDKYKYLILIIALATFLPFIQEHSYVNPNSFGSEGMYRTSGLWENSKQIGAYFLALMIILPTKRIYLISFIFCLVLYCGARSLTIASIPYMIYVLFSQFDKGISLTTKSKALATIAAGFLCLAIMYSIGIFDYLLLSLYSNFSNLFNFTSVDNFGSARGLLNRIAIEEIMKFDIIDLLAGQSYSMLANLYVTILGTATWPHNDFVMTFFCYGLIGFVFYVYYLFVFPWTKITLSKRRQLFAVQMSILVLAATTGFYPYMASFLFIASYGVIYEKDRRIDCNV